MPILLNNTNWPVPLLKASRDFLLNTAEQSSQAPLDHPPPARLLLLLRYSRHLRRFGLRHSYQKLKWHNHTMEVTILPGGTYANTDAIHSTTQRILPIPRPQSRKLSLVSSYPIRAPLGFHLTAILNSGRTNSFLWDLTRNVPLR